MNLFAQPRDFAFVIEIMRLLKYFKSSAGTAKDPSVRAEQPKTADKAETSSAEADRQKRNQYELKRKRCFVPSWLKEFTWLEWDKEQNSMFCRLCREFPKDADTNLGN